MFTYVYTRCSVSIVYKYYKINTSSQVFTCGMQMEMRPGCGLWQAVTNHVCNLSAARDAHPTVYTRFDNDRQRKLNTSEGARVLRGGRLTNRGVHGLPRACKRGFH